MAATNIKEQWSLREWCRMYGTTFTRAPFTNKETGEKFNSLVWSHNGGLIFVNFSQNLGELSNKDMRELKGQLSVYQVVKESGEMGFSLGKTGSINGTEESLDFD